MRNNQEESGSIATDPRRGERGAALIMALLVSALLLAAGSALIMATSTSAANMIDATAEQQAYYAAEAGTQAALNALRGHVTVSGTKLTFLTAKTAATANATGDTATVSNISRLSKWLPYSNSGTGARVTIDNNLSYDVVITDPNDPSKTDLVNQPKRLLISVNGYGPKGARKVMSALVARSKFEYDPPSTIMMISADDCSAMTVNIGNSAAKVYAGTDRVGAKPILPSVATTCAANTSAIVDSKESLIGGKDKLLYPGAIAKETIPEAKIMPWLQSSETARAFLAAMRSSAATDGVLTTGNFSGVSNGFRFVDGNCDLDGGSGLLIVTGNLEMKGNPSFSGLILVLGEGTVNRDGGGNGDIYGAIVVAKFARTYDTNGNGTYEEDDPKIPNDEEYPFLSPGFHTNGGGNSKIQYDSKAVDDALNGTGSLVLGVRET